MNRVHRELEPKIRELKEALGELAQEWDYDVSKPMPSV